MPRTEGMKQIAIDVPEEYRDRLTAFAESEDRSVRAVILRALAKYTGIPAGKTELKRGRPKKNPKEKHAKTPRKTTISENP